MRRHARAIAIHQLLGRRLTFARFVDEMVEAIAHALGVGIDQLVDPVIVLPPAHPPIGSSSGESREGNSAPDLPLVAGVLKWLTVDGQRENAEIAHYGNRSCSWPTCSCYSPQGPQSCRRSEAVA